MLLKLLIENYALIDRLEIEFTSGFSVITGETGAGKSILVGALSLILGERADTSVLGDPARKCIVEGTINLSGYGMEPFFSENDIDYDEDTVIRREISANGKSRAFINDSPVSVTLLRALSERLVSIHSQHSVITLSDASFQLDVLDDVAGTQADMGSFRSRFQSLAGMKRELADLLETAARSRSEEDYNRFLLDELEKAGLSEGEQEELEKQQEILAHSGEIKTGLLRSIHFMAEDEVSILVRLSETISALSPLAGFHDDIKLLVERLKGNQVDIKDILSDIQHLEPTVFFDQEESERIAARLDLIYRLQKKHLASTVEELISIRRSLVEKISATESHDGEIKGIESAISREEKDLGELAEKVSKKRTAAIPGLQKEMTSLLTRLGMPHARFGAEIIRSASLTRDGFDRVKFLFTANKGVDLQDLSKVASGGELSRLMLSIRTLITRKNLLPTIIFDEIDSGISGEVAGKVGDALKGMAARMQVIAITHLPQIAGKGDTHYRVFKKDTSNATRSMIRQLSDNERVDEIARMLSNEQVSEAAVMTARELLKH